MKKTVFLLLLVAITPSISLAQVNQPTLVKTNYNWLSLGGRSTISAFEGDGLGVGTGGQFRVQLSNRVNTEWFADYISITKKNNIRSIYYHIGWSVMYYPFKNLVFPKVVQPYIMAGHCFDYNTMTSLKQPTIQKSRLGSAVQAGLGTHFNITERFDITLSTQYMIHLTHELHPELKENETLEIVSEKHSALQGHLLTTLSINYKICRLWKNGG